MLFLVTSVAICLDPLEMRPILLTQRHEVGFLMTLECVTLKNPEMPFYAEICFLRRFDWILLRGFRRRIRTGE